MILGQLVCYGCQRIISYPLGAITCRCRVCKTVNSAQNLLVPCGACGQDLHVPINTLSLLCPCCGTITDIPEEMLPPLPRNINFGDAEEEETAIYVSHPTLPTSRIAAPPPAVPRAAAAAAPTATTAAAAAAGDASVFPNAASGDDTRRQRPPREAQNAEDAEEGVGDEAEGEMEAQRRPVAAVHLAPTVMIATRIL